MVTSSCGSLAEKVVSRPVRSLLRAAGAHDLVGHAVQVGERVAALVLQHELEAAEAAHALHRGRLKHRHQAAVGREHQHLQLGREVGHDVGGGVAFAAPLIGGRGGHKHHARVGGAAGEAEAHDGKCSGDIGILRDDGLCPVGQRGGVCQRRARRRLHDHHQVALVFLRNEAGGNVLVHPNRCAQAGEEDEQQQIAQLQRDMNDACIGAAPAS